MKLIKSLVASSLALMTAGTAFAYNGTHVYITGSTAYRGNTHTAIQRIMDAGYQYAYDGTGGIGSANHAIFVGTVNGGATPVVIKTSWSGSEAGIQSVSNSVAQTFMDDNNAVSVNGGSLNTGGTNITSITTESVIPQIAMADTYQAGARAAFQVNALTDNVVGVVPFLWVGGKGISATQNALNMTGNIAQALWTGPGYGPLSLLTGVAADKNTQLYATGRDPDSGTRATAFAESGIGIFNTVKQFGPVDAALSAGAYTYGPLTNTSTVSDYTKGFAGTITVHRKYPVRTINGISTSTPGNGGESSGGQVAKNISATLTAAVYQLEDNTKTAGYYVTYLGTGDAASALENGAVLMMNEGVAIPFPTIVVAGNTYNPDLQGGHLWPIPGGTQNSAITVTWDYTNFKNGFYKFWGYEHLDYLPALAGDALTVAGLLVSDFQSTDAQIKKSDMTVNRTKDGGPVFSN